MPTLQPRVNVVMDPIVYKNLLGLAKKEKTSLSSKANDLIKLALEIYEDVYWDNKAQEREENSKKSSMLTHKEVWG